MRISTWIALMAIGFAVMAYNGILDIAECANTKHPVACLIDR